MVTNLKKISGERIKLLRIKNNLKQAELAIKLGVSPSAIGLYEQGRRTPDQEILIEIAKIFNVTIDYLLGYSDSPKFTADDEKNIETDLKKYMDNLKKGISGPVMYDGKDLSDNDIKAVEVAIRTALEIVKAEEKQNK